MGTVTISSTSYTIYGTLTGVGSATEYLAAALHAVNWAGASDDDKKKALITATRFLQRQSWLVDDYADPDYAELPANIVLGAYELAEVLLGDASAAQAQTSAQDNIKRIKAGSVEIEKWRPVSGGRFPTTVQELVGEYLAGSSGATLAAPILNGSASDASAFDDDDFFDFTDPI